MAPENGQTGAFELAPPWHQAITHSIGAWLEEKVSGSWGSAV